MARKIQSARKGMTAPAGAPPPVHVQFQQQAERTPDAIALSWGGQDMTYAQLEGKANQLARHLQNLGVGPEITVGISVDRSADMIVAVLGVLKAGGAYVPLDPAYPPDRLAAMIEDSGIRVLITREHIAGSLPDNVPATVLMDSQWHEIAAGSALGVASSVKPENLAYIIYTSGSTGKPKGVMIEHHSLAAYVASAAPLLRFGPADRVLQFASLNFDASAEEIYCTLLAGGTLVLRSEAMLASTADFLKTVQDWRITVLDLPTAFWHMLAVDMSRQKLRLPQDVRLVIIGGERALPDRLSLWESCVGMGVSLLNGYGPTETTIASTMWKPDRSGQAQGASVPIGKPLNGVHAYVVDSSGKLAGEGSVGELWLGGFGVARGYLNQPAMTAQKFVPDPFGGGGRIYKSGDMVRRLPDGNLEFVGRVDHQVKVRGFRIELGEIESALNALESVRESVVTAKTGPAADTRLVAYIVPSRPDFRAGEIRQSLKGKLPEYMIPSAFVVLDAMPLGPTGKIDRAALPEPSRDARDRETPLVPPSTPAQEKLAAMWCELLGMDQVSIHDPFLELGGHSLLAAQLIARVRDQFDVDLTLRAVFDYPTVAAMAEHIERERVHAHGAAGPASMRAPRGGDLPLSFAQEAVWFFLRLHPVNVAYNSQAYLRMHGTLDAGALQRALTGLVRRHEIFRTTFHEADGRPVQRIHPPYEYELAVKDLEGVPQDRLESEAQNEIQREIRTPFDLTRLPLIRWKLLRLGPREHILIVVEQHFVHDGWSFNLLLSELKELYAAEVEGKPSPLPEPPIQFADFVHWQRAWMNSAEARAQVETWIRKLRGAPPLLELPTDRPRPQMQELRGASMSVDFPDSLYASLREFSRTHGTSLFMTMLAGFVTLLHRQSGMDDFCIGCGVANRRHRETEKVLGMIVNTVAIRSDFSGNPTLLEVLDRVRDTSLAALAIQDVPFEKIVEALQPKRTLSYLPVYQVMFGFHDSPLSEREFTGLTTELIETVGNGSAKSDLNVIVIPRSEQHAGQRAAGGSYGLTINWEYNSDLFDASTIRRMLEQYQRILVEMVERPSRRAAEIPLLSRDEHRRQAQDWNDTRSAHPPEQGIHALFEEQALLSPEATAIVHGSRQWSYGELNAYANRIAASLRRLGVRRGDRVGLCMDRSVEAIAGILGILKAGGAYLPLDGGLPAERLRFMVRDAGAGICLVGEEPRPDQSWFEGTILTVSESSKELSGESSSNPGSECCGDDLAYVMYTSGSTGQPKGVEVVHRGVVRLVKGQSFIAMGPAETFFQFAPLSFDASTLEIWGSLLNGARLVLCSTRQPSIQELGEEIDRQGVTTLWLTAALFEQVVDASLEKLKHVRQMLAGGDVLSGPHAQKFLAAFPDNVLVNGYGPTENTTFTTCFPMRERDAVGQTVPIGRPVSNTEVYILDRSMELVPVGVVGELYTGGAGLARGYMGRPDLTAEKFVPNSFGDPGSRLYRTGDRCRYREDGTIEFTGRRDHQVKIRGYRIELGEVESVLRRLPGVREAVALLDDRGGDKRLIAYCIPVTKGEADGSSLRAAMAETVPSYMVPSAIGILDSFPLTAAGKLDRLALPPIAVELPAPAGTRSAAMNPTQKLVRNIWTEILQLEDPGVHDNFFDLGGHSLLATQVISRIYKATGIEIALGDFFTSPTIAGLALVLEEKLLEAAGASSQGEPGGRLR